MERRNINSHIYIVLIMKKRIALFLIFAIALILTGCAKTNERDVFRFEAHQLELGLNESIELKLIMGSISEDEEIEYTLSEEGIITLEDNIATGINVGLVKVTAKVKNNPTTKATVEITVKDEKLSALKINGDSSVEVTGSLTLSVETIPSNISNEVVWSSSNEEIAKVDQNGKVTTYKPGKVSIKATSKYDPTLSALKEIDVLYKAGEELLLSFTKGDENVVLGTTSVLEAKVLPELANQTVVWTSSNEAIAKVVDGVITPVKVTAEEETVEITATTEDGKLVKSVAIKVVYAEIESIEVTGAAAEVFEEKEIKLTAKVLPATANQAVTWTSSDETVATVDDKGTVTGVKKGTAMIKATGADGTSYGEFEVTVVGVPDPESIKVTINYKEVEGVIDLEVECDETLRVSILPEDAKQEIDFVVSDENIISVTKTNAGFKVLGLNLGQATITFTSKVNPEIKVVVTFNIIPLE